MTTNALVTGASGFVGRHLIHHLKTLGINPIGLDRQGEDNPDHVRADITDQKALMAVLTEVPSLSTVFHLAGMTFVPSSIRDPYQAYETNLLGLVNLAEALERHHPTARIIVVGSSEAYGPPQRLPVDEHHPFDPRNPYAHAKAAADWYARFLSETHGRSIIRLRPFNHAGPGQRDDFVITSFALQIARIEAKLQPPVIQVGNLEARRDFTHVLDVVTAYEAAARKGRDGFAYNVCSGTPVAIGEILDRLLHLTTVPITVETDPTLYRPAEVPSIYGSHELLTDHTGWTPTRSIDDILRDVLYDCRTRLNR